jgi:hypothetical protein
MDIYEANIGRSNNTCRILESKSHGKPKMYGRMMLML